MHGSEIPIAVSCTVLQKLYIYFGVWWQTANTEEVHFVLPLIQVVCDSSH